MRDPFDAAGVNTQIMSRINDTLVYLSGHFPIDYVVVLDSQWSDKPTSLGNSAFAVLRVKTDGPLSPMQPSKQECVFTGSLAEVDIFVMGIAEAASHTEP